MIDCEVLLVTCCLERSRLDILTHVVNNLREQDPSILDRLTVVDNASTFPGTDELLKQFTHVHRVDRNVGYWTAIDWWLNRLRSSPPRYTYVIESDMIHYDLRSLDECIRFLDSHADLGAMRLHEYSIDEWYLYNKDAPVQGSKRNLWQSHRNKVTQEKVVHSHVEGPFYSTNFLTQLPALNRYDTMLTVFDALRERRKFSELDFQGLYHSHHPLIAIRDGGIFHCDLNPYGTDSVTGSWTDPTILQQLGYQSTRYASILSCEEYNVTDLS